MKNTLWVLCNLKWVPIKVLHKLFSYLGSGFFGFKTQCCAEHVVCVKQQTSGSLGTPLLHSWSVPGLCTLKEKAHLHPLGRQKMKTKDCCHGYCHQHAWPMERQAPSESLSLRQTYYLTKRGVPNEFHFEKITLAFSSIQISSVLRIGPCNLHQGSETPT